DYRHRECRPEVKQPIEEGLLQLKALLAPGGLTRSSTDSWGASTRHLAPDAHRPGQRHTQKIARPPLPLRTRRKRRVRKTSCLSKTTQRPDVVLGLLVNRYALGRAVYTWPSPLLEHYPLGHGPSGSASTSAYRSHQLYRCYPMVDSSTRR